jgi:hypothetical protein
MKSVQAFVISAKNRAFTLRYRGHDGQPREVTYTAKDVNEDARLNNAMATRGSATAPSLR